MNESQGLDGRRPVLQTLPFFPRSDKDVKPIPSDVHTGLWIDKYLPRQAKGLGQVKAAHFAQAVRAIDSLYKQFYERWEKSLAEIGVQSKRARVLGRLSIGLGGESVLETSISLHRTYGVPYIPGSALKGLAASYARKRLGDEWKAESDAYRLVFGDTKSAGYVTFYDALYIPGTAKTDTPLALDVMNVHHPEYYRGENVPPADWDSPTPVSFLSATGSYLLALHGPDEWVEAAFEILNQALKEEGIGAKTSSGYGRMEIEGFSTQPASTSHESEATPETPAMRRRGVIVEIRPDKRFGRVRDEESGQEYRFSIEVIEGNMPSKKAQVNFELKGTHVTKVRRT